MVAQWVKQAGLTNGNGVPSATEAQENTTALITVLESIGSSGSATEIALNALRAVQKAFHWDYGSYWILDKEENALRFSVDSGEVSPAFKAVTERASFTEGIGLSGRAWANRDLVFVKDLGELTDCCRRESAQEVGVQSGICFPIIVSGQVVGTMDFFALRTLQLSPERFDVLRSLGRLVSNAIARVQDAQIQKALADDVSALNQVLTQLGTATTQSDAIQIALKAVKDSFGWAYGSFWKLDPEKNALVFDLETGTVTPEFSAVTRSASFKEGVGLSGRAWAKRDLVFVKDLGELVDCCRRESAQKAGVKSGICFPIIIDGQVTGTMDFFATEVLTLSDFRLNTLKNIGQLLSKALERIKASELRQQAMAMAVQNSNALNQVLNQLGNVDATSLAVEIALKAVKESFGWAYGSYWSLDTEKQVLRFSQEVGSVNDVFRAVTQSAQFKEGEGLSGRAWKAKELVFVKDLGELVDCCRRESAQKAGVKSGICFPIIVNGKVMGTMDFFALETLTLSPERLETLKNINTLVSQAFQRIDTIQKTKAQAQAIQDKAANISEATQSVNQNVSMVAAAAEEMTASITEISKNTTLAAKTAKDAEESTLASRETIQNLGKAASSIGNVVDMIKSIAAQTNLLALNATIEAASAGDAGKGFAVVASEVKDLARQSASSVDEIKQKIDEIQGISDKVVLTIAQITEFINTINSINTVVSAAVEEQSATTSEISRNLNQAASGVSNISHSIEALARL